MNFIEINGDVLNLDDIRLVSHIRRDTRYNTSSSQTSFTPYDSIAAIMYEEYTITFRNGDEIRRECSTPTSLSKSHDSRSPAFHDMVKFLDIKLPPTDETYQEQQDTSELQKEHKKLTRALIYGPSAVKYQ